MKSSLNIGLVGVGRMGIAYARYLASRVPGAFPAVDVDPSGERFLGLAGDENPR